MSDFIWLKTPYDVKHVADKLGKDWSEIEAVLVDDIRVWCYSIFHIPTGERRSVLQQIARNYPRAYLERVFLNELWERPIEWEDIQARVWTEATASQPEMTYFRIVAVVDGETRWSSFRILTEELNDPTYPPHTLYRSILNGMVHRIDHVAKEERYGVIR